VKAGIIQSNYLPWRGYFDFIDRVDVFVVYDDVQFTVRDWRTRNRLKTPQGLRWLSVPVRHQHRSQLICETDIDYSRDWRREHLALVTLNLKQAPFLGDVLRLLEPAFAAQHRTISELNVSLLRACCGYLGIRTPIRLSTEFNAKGAKTERLLEVLAAVGADAYLSGPAAKTYLDEAQFAAAGIRLEYMHYAYPPYPQLWGPFDGGVSIIDTIANCGPDTRTVLTSQALPEACPAGRSPSEEPALRVEPPSGPTGRRRAA